MGILSILTGYEVSDKSLIDFTSNFTGIKQLNTSGPSALTIKLNQEYFAINQYWPRGLIEYPVASTTLVLIHCKGLAENTLNGVQQGIDRHSGPWDEQLTYAGDGVKRELAKLNTILAKFQSAKKDWMVGIDVKDVVMRLLANTKKASEAIDYADANDSFAWLPSWAEAIFSFIAAVANAVIQMVNWVVKNAPKALNTIAKYAPFAFWGGVGYIGYTKFVKK